MSSSSCKALAIFSCTMSASNVCEDEDEDDEDDGKDGECTTIGSNAGADCGASDAGSAFGGAATIAVVATEVDDSRAVAAGVAAAEIDDA